MNTRKKIRDIIFRIVDKYFSYISVAYMKKFTNAVMQDINTSAYIVSPIETLEVVRIFIVQQKRGAYMRFGDGDIFLALGKSEAFQVSGESLALEMKEAFSLKGKRVLKALMLHSDLYGSEKEMYIGNHLISSQIADKLLQYAYPFFVGYTIYSPVALHYVATYYTTIANEFLLLLREQAILFIGNENTPENIVRKLFGQVKHIKTPERNAYTRIDEIEYDTCVELSKQKKFGVVIVSMGCSGRVLIKRLYKQDYPVFFFDFGSLLDGICGNETRTWLKKSKIDYEVLLNGL